MKLNNFSQGGNEQEIKETENIKLSDVLIDTKDFLEYYEKDDYKLFSEKLKNISLPFFDSIFKILRKYKNINTVNNLNDATVEYITEKRFEIRNAINTVIGVKANFMDYRLVWVEIQYLTDKMYERTKDKELLNEEIIKLKNNDLRLSEVNSRLKELVKVSDKIGLIMIRFKQVDDEIKETLLYLTDVKEEMSRIQSAVQLALDTGEMEKVFWRKNRE